VTLSTTPTLIIRQRQNLGRARARGVELDADTRIAGGFHLRGGYAFTDGYVASFPPLPDLEGNVLPQLPRHQASLRLAYEGGRLGAGAAVRFVGGQFEDDRNELLLGPFAVVDLSVGWRMGRSTEAFLAAENLFDERYAVGLTPTATVGPPLLVRVGVRLRFGEVSRGVGDVHP
jgi:catecholate siderophore receptor